MVLFFLPHAGGSAKSYCTFKRYLPRDLKVVPMELSGRFTRSGEPLLTEVSACVVDLIQTHRLLLEQEPYALFGHSMGTLLAAELIRQTRTAGLPTPRHAFMSGRCAPCDGTRMLNADHLSDEELVQFFAQGGLSTAIPDTDPELRRMLNRILCTDVRMADRFTLTPEEAPFGCDITVLYGKEDHILRNVDLRGWDRFTGGKCDYFGFSGGHFFFAQHLKEICGLITERIC